jgi:hypothetical protein
MKIFISWSGRQSKSIAQTLRVWIPDVIQAVEPWASQADIQPGTRWAEELARALQQIRFGIICLTPDNLTAPWILYESGALSKTLKNSRVCPYLFSVKPQEIVGPLAQFQSVVADRSGTKRLIAAINDALGDNGLDKERLDRAFDNHWDELDKQLRSLPSERDDPSDTPAENVNQKLDRILDAVRSIERRLQSDRLR